ncbi:hypothetical protein ACFOOP_05430 [Marinicaulis aureus]|uniref:Uncharacterized protein n=1 Tax=Hyphococcus aureus TaxID=2666033 RepID=A0ABW1KU20_9PROT
MSVFLSRLAAGACAAALFFSPANAETAPASASTALLAQAAQKARDFADYRYAYTVEHLTRTGEKEVAITLRFDPRLEGDARWQVLSPAEDALDKPQAKALKQLRKGEMEDSPILYDSLDEMIDDVELASENETEAVYVAQLDDDDAPKDALEVFITLNKPDAYISSIELKSKKPFKPAPVAKVMKLVQTQRFAAPEGNGPALIVSSEAHIEGEAMFKSFSTDTRQIFSEIEQVEVPAEESDEG